MKEKIFKRSVLLMITFSLVAIALSPDVKAAEDYSMELVRGSSAPLIDRSNPGSAGNRNGYEGGTVFMYKGDFHLFGYGRNERLGPDAYGTLEELQWDKLDQGGDGAKFSKYPQ